MKAEKELKKKENVMKILDDIFEAIESVFIYGGPVKEIIFSMGATIVSPKEIYCLKFPTTFHEGSTLSFKQCSSLLFRKLVSSDFLGDCPHMKPGSKMNILIRAPRNCEIASKKLVPRLVYKEPTRCNRFELNFKCRAPVASAELSRIGDFDCDISGIEPLDLSHIRTPGQALHKLPSLQLGQNVVKPSEVISSPQLDLIDKFQGLHSQPGSPIDIERNSVTITVSDPNQDGEDMEDFIWYQIPVTLTGYVDKVSKKASSESMFMI